MRSGFDCRAVFSLLARLLVVAGVLWPAAAVAAGAKAIAVVVEGGDADAVAGQVAGTLPPELRVIDDKTFAEALRKAGQSGPFGNALMVKGGLRDKMLARAQKAMETAGADAAILGRVRIGKLGKEVWIVWLSAGGDVAIDQAVSLRGTADEQRAALKDALSSTAKALVPPPETGGPGGPQIGPGPDEKPSDTPVPETPDPKSTRPPHLYATELFEVGIAFEMGGRHMTFNDAITQNIRPYDVLGVPMIAASGAVYPAAGTSIPVLKNIGVAARFAMAVGLTSSTKAGQEAISNTWLRFRAGLRWRFVPGTEKGPVLTLTGDYGMDTFTFDKAGPLEKSVPSVDYSYLRAGGEVRLPIGPLALELGGGYRGLLGVGAVGGRFTGASALAFDGFVGFAVPLPAGLEARLSGDYSRVFYAFQPIPGDEYVAGGAVDEMLGARLGVAYVY